MSAPVFLLKGERPREERTEEEEQVDSGNFAGLMILIRRVEVLIYCLSVLYSMNLFDVSGLIKRTGLESQP